MKKIKATSLRANADNLFNEICFLVDKSKESIAIAVNHQLTMLYWQIGHTIQHDILKSKRADYGEEIVSTLSKLLTAQYGKGFSKPQLWNCLYTVEIFPDPEILSTLSRELSWSHIKGDNLFKR